MSTSVGRGCRVVNATDPYGRYDYEQEVNLGCDGKRSQSIKAASASKE
jgi:hypothetical protein